MSPPRSSTGAAERIILGIDPGLTRCGIGVVAGTRTRLRHVHHATLRTTADTDLADRLATMFAGLEDAVAAHRPDLVAVERVLFSRNVRTAMATGQAAGVALVAARRAGVPVVEITPTSVKATVAGHGDADKDAVARMVTMQLGLEQPPTPADAADALAVAMAAILQAPAAGVHAAGSGSGAAGEHGGWAAHLAARGLEVVGGTGSGGGRSTSGRSSSGRPSSGQGAT